MSVMYFFSVLMLSLTMVFLAGYPIAVACSRKAGADRILWAFPLGLGAIIVTVRSVQLLFPISQAAPFIFFCILLGALLFARDGRKISALLQDIISFQKMGGETILIIASVVALLINLPIVTNAVITFEGPGHDSIFYVANAMWMQHHSYFSPIVLSVTEPSKYLDAMFFGARAPLGRVGAEGYLALVSALIGREPVYCINAVQTTVFFVVGITSVMVVGTGALRRSGNFARVLISVAIFASPIAISIPLNSNFSTLFGIASATTFALSGWKKNELSLAGRAILFGALLASYAELVPFALIWRGGAALIRGGTVAARSRVIWFAIKRLAVDTVATCAAIPWIAYSAWYVIHNAYFVATSEPNSFPNIYAGMSPFVWTVAYLTGSTKFASNLPGWLAALTAIIALIAFLLTLINRRVNPALRAAVLTFAASSIAIVALNFSYGLVKAPQYFSVFITAALAIQLVFWRLPKRSIGKVVASGLKVLVLGVMLFGATYTTLIGAYWLATQKFIDKDLISFITQARAMTGRSTVAIATNRDPFYYSMWLALLLDKPVRFIESTNGGFLAPYLSSQTPPPLASTPYVITDSNDIVDPSYPLEKAMLQIGPYRLLPLHDGFLSVTGMYNYENGYAWMSGKLQIYISGNTNANYINVSFGRIFENGNRTASVSISSPGRICSVSLASEQSAVSIKIPTKANAGVVVEPDFPARSPQSMGISNDPRPLTIQVRHIFLSNEPVFSVPVCTEEK